MPDMTESEPEMRRLRQLELRLARLEEDRRSRPVSAACARCYVALAGVVIVLSFLPILREPDEYGRDEWSLWEMAGQDQQGGVAGLGAYLMIALVVLLVVAAFRPAQVAGKLDGSIAAIAVLLAVLLVTRPDSDEPLTGAGQAGVAILILTAVLGIAHLTYVSVHRRRAREANQRWG